MYERPVSHVPGTVLALLAAALIGQASLKGWQPVEIPEASDLPPPPGMSGLRLASLGDPIPLAKVLMLYLQAFDYRAGSVTPYRSLDYDVVERWLSRILSLDPAGQYPLLAASRLYAEVPDEVKVRKMLDFVYGQFLLDPQRRWPWLAHAAVIAKHRLNDLPLARRYAAAIQQHASGPGVPLWARQMEAFILEDMNELETARVMIGGFLASGSVTDPAEARFLEQRLNEIEARLKNQAHVPRK